MTSTESESVPLQSVHMPLNMDPETATYVAMLEGTIAALVINDCKQRTLLELLTGDGWEAARVDFNGNALIGLATAALVKQTGMNRVQAQILVTKRWNERNHPADYVVPQAISTDDYIAGESGTGAQLPTQTVPLSERVKSWRARQQAEAEKVSQEQAKISPDESVSDSKSAPGKSGTNVPKK